MNLKLVFFGTPEFALPSLQQLLAQNRRPLLVVTQTDKIRGRGKQTSPTPVKALALEQGIPVITPENVNAPEVLEQLQALKPDLFLTAAYGQIFRKAFLALPRLGTLNVHASLLPKYRGSAPYQWAIIHGEKETGITIIEVVRQLDAGPMLKQARFPISPEDTGATLHDKLAELGGKLLLETVQDYEENRVQKIIQEESQANQYGRLTKDNGLLLWTKPAQILQQFIRGMQPWPKAQTHLRSDPTRELLLLASRVVEGQGAPGEILQFDKHGIRIACGINALEILQLQLSGKKEMDAKAFVNGNRWNVGDFLGSIL